MVNKDEYILRVTASETEIKNYLSHWKSPEMFSKLFQRHWTCLNIDSKAATTSHWNSFEIISGTFPRAETKFLQTEVDELADIILLHV